jgi:hypothetical protein
MIKKIGGSEKIKFWEEKIVEWRQSGLSRKDFCGQNGLKITRLGYWVRKIGNLEQEESLVEVKADHSLRKTAYNPVEIIVSSGYRINVSHGFDHRIYCEVIKALESQA